MMRRLVIAGLLVGLAVGLALAAVLPRTEPSNATPRGASTGPGDPRPAPAGDPAHPRTAHALHAPTGPGYVRLRATTRPAVEVRRPDPRGGPDWVVRTFRALRFVKDRGEPAHVVGRPLCVQLGRVHRGRFGWVDATNTFRPVGIVTRGAPLQCGSIRADMGRTPFARGFSRITDPTAGAARALQTVAWGLAGSAGRPRLRIAGLEIVPPRTPNGAFLALAPARVQVGEIAGEVAYPGGRPVRLRLGSFPGRATIEFRSPDPNGGLPFGIGAARRPDGRWCASGEGRIVGDRVGGIDFDLGTFTDHGPDPNGVCADHEALGLRPPPAAQAPTRDRPLLLSYSFGQGNPEEYGLDPGAGRTARRTLRGMTTIQGVAHPDVEAVTFTSPRDVRTLRPSPRAHVLMVLYDGTFPTGAITMTSRFRDGTTATDKIEFAGAP
jgi:hypothetical protein